MEKTKGSISVKTNEFGMGLSYSLGLFLMHAERAENDTRIWFNGAADHLYGLIIPNGLPHDLQNRIKAFQNKCFALRYADTREEDKKWALDVAKSLLIEIDRYYGIAAEKGELE